MCVKVQNFALGNIVTSASLDNKQSVVSKMAIVQEKARYVLWFAGFKSSVAVPREFQKIYKNKAPDEKSIKR